MAEWQVSLNVSGPITTNRPIKFRAEKGFVDPFWTEISVRRASHGVVVGLVARAGNQADANDAALYFVGHSTFCASRLTFALRQLNGDTNSSHQ